MGEANYPLPAIRIPRTEEQVERLKLLVDFKDVIMGEDGPIISKKARSASEKPAEGPP